MTTPDPYTDLDQGNPAVTGNRGPDRGAAHPQGHQPAGTNLDPAAVTGDTYATDSGGAPGAGLHEPRAADSGEREPLVPRQRSEDYSARWDQVKGGFVDEPRQAVAAADQLVSELLEELQELFRGQRRDIEQGLDANEGSTEDLRLALRRYRSFFDRLLSV